jgi:MFS family permease
VTESATPWNDPVWRRFFTAHAVSVTGTALTGVVLPILLYQRTGSAGLTALLTALQTVPYLLFGLFAGAISDRRDRRRIMIVSDVAAALIVGSVPVADAFGILGTGQLIAVAAGLATCFVWFDAANFGALPALVGRDRVVRASSSMWTFDSVALIVGPAIGAIIATSASPSIALAIDAFSYLVSAFLMAGVKRAFATSDRGSETTMRETIVEGLRYLWHAKVIRALTLAGFGNSVSFGAVLGLTVPYAVRRLGLSNHDYRIGVLVAFGAVGSLMAALALPRIGNGKPPPRVSTYALLVAAAMMLALGFTRSFAVALPIWLFWQAGAELAILNGVTYRQTTVPDEFLGRVNVVARMVSWGGQPFGAAIGGVIATVADVRVAFVVMVVPVTVAALSTARTLHRAGHGAAPRADR